jgi:hypothetical protein
MCVKIKSSVRKLYRKNGTKVLPVKRYDALFTDSGFTESLFSKDHETLAQVSTKDRYSLKTDSNMRRIYIILSIAFAALTAGSIAFAQTGGPAWRPKTNTPTPPSTTTVPYVPAPNQPYAPVPAYNPTYTQQSQVQAQLNSVQQQEASLRQQLANLRQQEKQLKEQLAAMNGNNGSSYQDGYRNGYRDAAGNSYASNHHDNGKHKGQEKNGKGGHEHDDD